MVANLDSLVVRPKTGDELFLLQGVSAGATVHSFWRWACSDLVGNAMRGVLAEYIVGLALGCVDEGVRSKWDACDLCTRSGARVEVKSAAYLQTWTQRRLSRITFSIAPTNGWDAGTNTISAERRRQSDVYVFCVLKHTDKSTVNPLDLDQWDFYVLSTSQLNAAVGEQKKISLARLLTLKPAPASFAELRQCVAAAAPASDS